MLEVAAGDRPSVNVYGSDYPTRDGTCVRDYVHVSDIADAHLLALDALDRLGLDWFNIGTGTGNTVDEVVKAVERVTGRQVTTVRAARRPGDPATLVASSDRIRQMLGWSPRCPDLDEIIATAWRWRQQHPGGYGD